MATYVLSDVHGQYDYYKDVLKQIDFKEDDQLYIIGDIIDRGPEPIKLIQEIINKTNITFLLGNHEDLMIRSLLYKDELAKTKWMKNGGQVTLEQFEDLDSKEQEEILKWLESRPITIPKLTVNKKTFMLSHASHPLFKTNDILYYKTSGDLDRNQSLWSRDYQYVFPNELGERYSKLYNQYKGVTLIFGHSPVYYTNYGRTSKEGLPQISRTGKGHLINIDCGCAKGFPLGCLRLDDMKEFYAKLPDDLRVAK